MVTRKKLDDEIVLRREMLKNNYSRASAYYKSAFKDCAECLEKVMEE